MAKIKSRTSCVGVLSLFWALNVGSGALMATAAHAGVVDSLLALAQSDTTRPLGDRIAWVTKALNKDRDRADVCAVLGRLYMLKNSPAGRLRADRYLYRAVVLEPENIDYRMDYATLQRKKGFRYNAMKYFEKILTLDSTQVEAACEIGDYYLQDMLKYVDARRFDGGGSMRSFAMESVETAVYYYEYARAQDPNCRRAYYGLGLLSLEGGFVEDLVVIAQELLSRWPDDRDGLLFLGLGHYATDNFEGSEQAFDQAFAQMDSVGQAAMTSVELLGGGDDDEFFWQKRDPLYLTSVNERLLAHRGRVAYANLRFGLPDEGIAGWNTDMGKAWIRYGRYVQRTRTLIPHREIWDYEDFSLDFFSYDSVHWKLELMKDQRWALVPGGWGRSQVLSSGFYMQERYVDPYVMQKYDLPVQVGVFRASIDKIRVALSWGVPKQYLQYLELYNTHQIDVDAGVFAHQLNGKPVVQDRWQPDTFQGVWVDSLKGLYLLGQRDLVVVPDSLTLSLEVRDQAKETVGVFRDTVALSAFPDHQVAMSSLLLASLVEEREDGLQILPNPLRIFQSDELLYMYFEVYNLTRDEFGQTDFSVAYRIGPPDLRRFASKADRKVIEKLSGDEDLWRISVSTDYQNNQEDEKLYLAVDISELSAGVHLLSVVVTDKQTGLQVWRETLFRIM